MARKPKPETDDELLSGHPATDADPDPDPDSDPPPRAKKDDGPARKKVTIGEREFEVDPANAAVFEAMAAQYNADMTALRQSRTEPAKPAPKGEDEDPLAGIDEMLFTDPRKALSLYGDTLRKEFREEFKKEQQKIQGQTSAQQFWSAFWASNTDLSRKDDQLIAEVLLDRNLKDFEKYKDADSLAEALGDKVREEYLRISRRGKGKGKGRAQVEGGGKPPEARADAEDAEPGAEQNVHSISQFIKDRRRARREKRRA